LFTFLPVSPRGVDYIFTLSS